MFFQNELGRNLARTLYRVKARAMIFSDGPKIFVNSLPKAGTHLLTGVLDTLEGISGSGLHIETREINTLSQSRLPSYEFELHSSSFTRLLKPVRDGQYVSCHLRYNKAAQEILKELGFKHLFIVRDPRDVLVSLLFYIKGLKRHPLHKIIMEDHDTDEQRLILLLKGKNNTGSSDNFVGYVEQLEMYAQWIRLCEADNSVCLVKFEDLISKKNTDDTSRLAAIEKILKYLDLEYDENYLAKVSETARGKKSYTFRKGASGEWNDVFSSRVKQDFDNECAAFLDIYHYDQI